MEMAVLKRKQAWKNALIATTGLSVFFVVSTQLWLSGFEEWAFLLLFMAVWGLISLSWSNVDFTEESGTILAGIMDHNFRDMGERIEELEQELAVLRSRGSSGDEPQSAANRQEPHAPRHDC